MDEKSVLTGVLTKTLNKTEGEVADLLYTKSDDSDEVTLNEDALNLILGLDASRVDNIKSNVKPSKKALQAEYDKGVYDAMSKLEGELRTAYEVDGDAKGIDLVKEIVHTVSECSKEITDDDVKAHPLYRALEKSSVTKDDHVKLQTEYNDYKFNQERISSLGKVHTDALAMLPGLKPIESKNSEVAQSIRTAFLNEFDTYNYKVEEDGTRLIMREDKRIDDPHGNPVKFLDFVMEKAKKYYEFEAGAGGDNAGNTNDGTQLSHAKVPKTLEEYHAMMAALLINGTPEQRIELAKLWEESQKSKK